ncbi:class II glutamine amidotransferase [Erwinia aphidicola]|uniref:class II glutamine amidotransferase n=1 Tax=Erwinia aphidicola TaxID=68334 RepID=UPI003BAEDC1F
MCELLGMSANVPTDICFSFTGLVQRGGERVRIKMAGALPFMKERAAAHLKIHSPASSRRLRAWCRSTR